MINLQPLSKAERSLLLSKYEESLDGELIDLRRALLTIDELERELESALSESISSLKTRNAELESRQKKLVEALTIVHNTIGDVTSVGAFAPSVDPMRWMRQVQEHLAAVLREIGEGDLG